MWLFALFLAVPLIEIALFIQVGGWIGLFPTLGIVVLTVILGTVLVRSQGTQAINGLRGAMADLRDPTDALAHGAMILFSGALLLTPGFFTDAVGFALLIPAVRQAIIRRVRARIKVAEFEYNTSRAAPRGRSNVIDGDFEDVTPPPRGDQKPSGWTQH
ncbi:MAG: FxsA family protein [Pseudomonadota bacterium]